MPSSRSSRSARSSWIAFLQPYWRLPRWTERNPRGTRPLFLEYHLTLSLGDRMHTTEKSHAANVEGGPKVIQGELIVPGANGSGADVLEETVAAPDSTVLT